jgi:hypothetical protein
MNRTVRRKKSALTAPTFDKEKLRKFIELLRKN